MTVYDVLKKAEPSQRMRITDDARGEVNGTAASMYNMVDVAIMSMGVKEIRTEGNVIVLEVENE